MTAAQPLNGCLVPQACYHNLAVVGGGLGAHNHLVAAEDACIFHAVAPYPQGKAAGVIPSHGSLLIFQRQDGQPGSYHPYNRYLAGACAGGQRALASLLPRRTQEALGLQRLQVIAYRGSGAQSHGLTDFPHGRRIAVFLDEFIDKFEDFLWFCAGSGHGGFLLASIGKYFPPVFKQ